MGTTFSSKISASDNNVSDSISFIFQKKLKTKKLHKCKLYKSNNIIKCATIHYDPEVNPPITAILNNNGFWHKDYEIIFWSLQTDKNDKPQMIQTHYINYRVHDNGIASAQTIDDAQFIIADNAEYLIVEHQNKLNIVNQAATNVDHRELKTNECIELIENEDKNGIFRVTSERMDYFRTDMKFFYDDKLSPNLLLCIGFEQRRERRNNKYKYKFIIIDCKTKEKVKEIKIKNTDKTTIHFIKLNNIGLKDIALMRGITAPNHHDEINMGLVHMDEHKDYGVEYGIYTVQSRNPKEGIENSCSGIALSPNNKYIAFARIKLNSRKAVFKIDMFDGDILESIYHEEKEIDDVVDYNGSLIFEIDWVNNDIVLFYNTLGRYIYVVKNAVMNKKKRTVLINLITKSFGEGYEDIVDIVASMIGFELDMIYACMYDFKHTVKVNGFCDGSEHVYCVYAGNQQNIKLVKL